MGKPPVEPHEIKSTPNGRVKRTGIYERNMDPKPVLPVTLTELASKLTNGNGRAEWFAGVREYLRATLRAHGVEIDENGLPVFRRGGGIRMEPYEDDDCPEIVRTAAKALADLHGLDTCSLQVLRAFQAGQSFEEMRIRQSGAEQIVYGKTIEGLKKAAERKRQAANHDHQRIVKEYKIERPGRTHQATIDHLAKSGLWSESTIKRALKTAGITAKTKLKK